MRISSLDRFPPLDSAYAMLLESSEQPFSFPPATSPVTFCFAAEQLADVAELPLVLVDTDADEALPILRQYATANHHVEYWAPRTETVRLQQLALAKDSHDLSITGSRLTENWIQLRIGPTTEHDRSCADWVEGLKSATAAPVESTESPSVAVPEMSLRSLVISRITPVAKPLKKYLPGSVVTMLYKILEKIR
ncbi:hypothetical protein FQN05_06710 [Corynebacterium aurimucosum]|uniref:Uncharacterized protein n=1 Tax=Corynebacterium aurimucosum TaxID=169292 RepID=A0A558IQF8_9CORY|nr:hypothetical protein [Corynebacterium aurimucosum]TVU83643.1 hypothetical protein FQN05_06710 [Corynebacterium aurimucosum]